MPRLHPFGLNVAALGAVGASLGLMTTLPGLPAVLTPLAGLPALSAASKLALSEA